MSLPQEISADLKTRLTLCQELLQGIEREGQALRRSDLILHFSSSTNSEKKLLPLLTQSLEALRGSIG